MARLGRPSTIRPALKKFNRNPRTALANLYSTRTLSEVAAVLGVASTATVLNAMKHFGIRRRAQRTPAPQGRLELALTKRGQANGETARKVFIRLYQKQGLTLRQIADQLDVTAEGLRSFAKRSEIPLRRRGTRKVRAQRSRNAYEIICI